MLALWQLVSLNQQYAFFLGEPVKVAGRVWSWFMPFGFGESSLFPEGVPGNADIYLHLGVTLLEKWPDWLNLVGQWAVKLFPDPFHHGVAGKEKEGPAWGEI